MTRRDFLHTSAGVAAYAQAARPASAAAPGEGTRLGFDVYSVRGFQWKALRLLDYAAELKLDTVHMDLSDFESEDPAYVRQVKERAASLGLVVEGSISCVCPTSSSWRPQNVSPTAYLLRGLHTFRALGATRMRCFLGSGADRTGKLPLEQHIDGVVQALRSVRAQAMDANIKIAVETHGDLQASEMKNLVEAAGKDFVGVCLDSGNPVSVIEDPFVTLETLGPYVLTSHMRDSVVFDHPKGAAWQWVALGDGVVDFGRFVARFHQLAPEAAVNLEIITGRPVSVHAYFEPDFWKAYPNTKAAEFARFVEMAKHGRPFMGSMIIGGEAGEPAAYAEALKQQQKFDLERSLEYAKKTLGLGLRWKA